MLSFNFTVGLVTIFHISGGNTARNGVVEETAIGSITDWLQTNIHAGKGENQGTIPFDVEHQRVATAVAKKLVTEQAEPIDGKVRLVDGGAVWLLIFLNIPGASAHFNALAKIKKILENELEQVKDELVNLNAKGILAQAIVAVCVEETETLTTCAVFVKGDDFLFNHQNSLILQDSKKRFGSFKAYIDSIVLKEYGFSPVLVPMSSRAILEAINYSELQKNKNNPILRKIIQRNRLVRRVMFEGKLEHVFHYRIVESKPKTKLVFAKDIKLNALVCFGSNIPAFGVVLCENGSFYIVGCCTEPQKIFQAHFSTQIVEPQEIFPSANNIGASSSRNGSGKPLQTTETGAMDDNNHITIDLTAKVSDTSSNLPQNQPFDTADLTDCQQPIYQKDAGNPESEVPIPKEANGPTDVTALLKPYLRRIRERPTQPNVMASGNQHILQRMKYSENEIPPVLDAALTVIITVKLGDFTIQDSSKYRLVRIEVGSDSISLDEIKTVATAGAVKIFEAPDENVKWTLKNTIPELGKEFVIAAWHGLAMFAETILVMGFRPGYDNPVSRCINRLINKKPRAYFGAAAQRFGKEGVEGDFVQITVQFSE